ncbi:MAG: hypothetical protein LAO77_17980 [Acidobacteriia bacterium]|nr:hypothetical protein [Terriglobia bacterium]
MKWLLLICAACAGSVTVAAARLPAAARPDLSGDWTLNRAASDFPKDVGFDPDWQDASSATPGRGGSGGGRSGGGRGGRGGGGGRSSGSGAVPSGTPRFESEDDVKKIRELVEEVKDPPPALTIAQTDTAVTIAFGRARTRTFHPTGKEETLQLDAGPIGVVTKWEPTQLVIRFNVEKDRELRYTLSGGAGAGQLVMEAQFAEKNRGDVIRRVYDVAK